MPQSKLDLSPGTVLHIKDFSSRGHPSKNKYLIVIGSATETLILGFLISSQMVYLERESHRNEVVRVPHNATAFMRSESIIQCFELERLSLDALCNGFEDGHVTRPGKLPIKYLHRIRQAVKDSKLLSQEDIEVALRLLPVPTHE